MGPVRLTIGSHHANVRIARLVAGSVCRLADLPDHLTDDIRLATGEACGRAVSAHQDAAIADGVVVEMEADAGTVLVTVRDQAPGGAGEPADLPGEHPEATEPASLGDALTLPDALTIVRELVGQLEIRTSPSGTTVAMRWDVSGAQN